MHVQKLHLRAWATLFIVTDNNPKPEGIFRQNHKRWDIRSVRGPQLTEADCVLLIQAARGVGVIEEDAPLNHDTCNPGGVDKAACVTPLSSIPSGTHACDRTFCEHLQAGCEDPLVALLIALLPNVRDIVLDGVPGDLRALIWQPKHGFPALRTLTACATDGKLQWPLTYFQPLLASGKLQMLRASHTTSASLPLNKRKPMAQALPLLVLLPGTLALEQVELENCCLRASDLQSLLRSCSGLRGFLYTSRRRGAGPCSPSPAEFVELLRPLQTTLEGLILDVEVRRHKGKTDDKLALIHSLTHMTALKVLVTTPEMWRSVTVEDATTNNDGVRSGEQRLSVRIPPNVETLVFGMSEAEKTTSPSQVSDLVRMRTAMLPNLTSLSVGGIDSVYVQEIKRLYLDLDSFASAGPRELHAEIGPIYVRSVFDTTQLSHIWKEVRWAERMYRTSPTENSLFARAYERIRRELPR